MTVLELRSATKRFGGFTAVERVDLCVTAGSTHAIIGPNGAGKTTLFDLVSGLIEPDEGTISFCGLPLTQMKPHEIVKAGIARSFQKVNIFPRRSCLENVQVALIASAGQIYSAWRSAADLFREEAAALLAMVDLAQERDRRGGELAYGKQKLLELAVALAGEPKLLLLDEPTAGMSIAETRASIALIKDIVAKRKLTLLFTEHDMEVVFDVASTISVLHQGRIIVTDTPAQVRANDEVRRIYLGKR